MPQNTPQKAVSHVNEINRSILLIKPSFIIPHFNIFLMNTLEQRIKKLKETFQQVLNQLLHFIDEQMGLFLNPQDESLVTLLK
jgi:hypothetical protein